MEQRLKDMGILTFTPASAILTKGGRVPKPQQCRFHAHLGYKTVGTFKKCGYKFGRWYDMIWMEKCIGTHTDTPAPSAFDRCTRPKRALILCTPYLTAWQAALRTSSILFSRGLRRRNSRLKNIATASPSTVLPATHKRGIPDRHPQRVPETRIGENAHIVTHPNKG